jgi:hypothetical protein
LKVIRGSGFASEEEKEIIGVELTRRNLEVLLAKLDMPDSARTIIDPTDTIFVRAVENEVHYANRAPGPMLVHGELETKYRRELWLNHGHPVTVLYGDDGEMQCSACPFDFSERPSRHVRSADGS